MIYLNSKTLFVFAVLALGFAQLGFAMEKQESATKHKFPTLHWNYVAGKAIYKIADPKEWRQSNSYQEHKREIEVAIDEKPELTLLYSKKRFESIVLDPVVHKQFHIKDIDELFIATVQENIVGNHFVFMKECNESWCPLSRSVVKVELAKGSRARRKARGHHSASHNHVAINHKRREFENDFVERIKLRFNNATPLRYVGFASGLSLLGDVRILMKLKMAGYTFEKIQFIDPIVEPVIQFAKLNVEQFGSAAFPLPMDGAELKGYYENNSHHFEMIMNTHLIAQFLAILSNYPGDEVIEYYPNVRTYLADDSNLQEKAHIITTFDLLDPRAHAGGFAEQIMRDFDALKNHNEGALIGSLFADYLASSPKSQFAIERKNYPYTLISVSNECESCKKLGQMSYCSACQDKKVGYCSVECQRKDWSNHKQFHPKKL
jgi:hypothetical protein